ncbi:sulfur carrier protein ThiS [Hydrogenophaga defluvii]|uniref:Sulfur carrier protein ThiS n=1 Tax=Hydrogenophaga defluvii TaxID=249410 RepID=A0ABW2S8X7_9BURK
MSDTLHFNDQLLPCQNGLTLAELLRQQGLDGAALATAVNGHFVPRERREHHPLQAGDQVLTFQAIVGG